LESPSHDRAEFDVGMPGLGDLVAGFDEGGGNISGAGGQEGFAVVVNFLVQSPMAHHNGKFGEPGAAVCLRGG
jgi:hypothetical protein